ncbi:VanZ family protein [Alkalihalophilus pseudofirmus]|uniref:VanZ family protein n=1 Tax=Alkalihalophilus pseudofirmus TaxID=79885 RepID=UPI00259B4B88|nr:VanZ family protein [Alkalihalophilus pseudofirmus]WEG18883.1 VanZ family protein [Alkalihalophilus pseudofirmus]
MIDLLMFKFVGLPLFFLFIIGENIFYWKSKNKPKLTFRLLIYSFSIYLLYVINYTIFPIPIGPDSKFMAEIMELKNNFIPFQSIFTQQGLLSFSTLGNLILLLPLGIYLPLILKRNSFYRTLLYGLCVSLGIELTQLVLSLVLGVTYRTFNIDDLILNTLGVAVGYLVYLIIRPLITPIILNEKNESTMIK